VIGMEGGLIIEEGNTPTKIITDPPESRTKRLLKIYVFAVHKEISKTFHHCWLKYQPDYKLY
jgi:hypothetical protein